MVVSERRVSVQMKIHDMMRKMGAANDGGEMDSYGFWSIDGER